MGVDVYDFVSSLNCVVAQRLVRKNCERCKQERQPSPEILAYAGIDPETASGHTWYEGTGCKHCGDTGYRDRAAVAELLNLSWRIREMIVDRRPATELVAAAIEEGMVPLRESALNMARAGQTTLSEVNRVTLIE